MLAWLGGLAVAVAVLGPALRPGSLINLDLVVTPRIPVPSGVWALGPELPRRVPLFVPIAWASVVVGTYAVKLVLLAAIAAAGVGASRLVAPAGSPSSRVGAGLLYSLSPFLLTRVAVGDISLVVVYALLPWAVPTLLRPSRDLPRTFLWSAALGACGFAGGLFVLPVVLVGLVRERMRAWRRVVGLVLVSQLPWIVPGIVVVWGGPHLATAPAFATHASGVGGSLRVLAGEGFWQLGNQLGAGGATGAVAGLVLILLAAYGHRRLDASWRAGAASVAVIGLVVTFASVVPGIRDVYESLSATAVGGTIREGQRLLPLYLVWAAPAAAHGAARLAERARSTSWAVLETLPSLLALVLAASALWGAGGRLDPVEFPAGWRAARAAVASSPGTVLALPWDEYLDFQFAGNRRSLYPARDWFGGDVVASSDPELGPSDQEQVDPRDTAVLANIARLKRGEAVSGALGEIGIRWIFLAREFDWKLYDAALASDSGLRAVVTRDDAALFEVSSWRGTAWDASGRPVAVRQPVAPIARTPTHGSFTWAKPANSGWLRGFEATGQSRTGLVTVPAGRASIWYWPAALVLVVDIGVISAVVFCAVCAKRKVWRVRRPGITSWSTVDIASSKAQDPPRAGGGAEQTGVAG
ncbi:MAG TPA: hypothetical protein VGP92_08805 [Acidimicrobiia bacterium]|nr:hypothetical protein [Acidimicrobiia bacterium]